MINCSITTIELVRSTTVEGFHVGFSFSVFLLKHTDKTVLSLERVINPNASSLLTPKA